MSSRMIAILGLALAAAGCGGAGLVGEQPGGAPPEAIEPRIAPREGVPEPADPAEFVKALPANPRKISDGLVRSREWKSLVWGNPASVSPWRKRRSAEDVVLVAFLEGGKNEKTAVSRPVEIVANANGQLRMDVYSADPQDVPIAFAVFSSADRVYSESAQQRLKHGWNRIAFDLSAPTFKTAASSWNNDTTLWGPDDIREIALLFYTNGPAAFAIDGIEVDGRFAESE